MTGHPTPDAVVFEKFVLEQLLRHADYLFTLESDLRDLLGVEMVPAPRITLPAAITSATATEAIRQANAAARAFATAARPDAGTNNFREVERDADGRVAAVIDPVAAVRRRAVRDADGRVIGFLDEHLGGGA